MECRTDIWFGIWLLTKCSKHRNDSACVMKVVHLRRSKDMCAEVGIGPTNGRRGFGGLTEKAKWLSVRSCHDVLVKNAQKNH